MDALDRFPFLAPLVDTLRSGGWEVDVELPGPDLVPLPVDAHQDDLPRWCIEFRPETPASPQGFVFRLEPVNGIPPRSTVVFHYKPDLPPTTSGESHLGPADPVRDALLAFANNPDRRVRARALQ